MHRIGWCIATCVLLCMSTARADYQLTQSATNVECYDFLELTLKSDTPIPGNPFTDAQFTGRFSSAEHQPISVDGFAGSSDGREFRIRFMPTTAGPYDFSLRLQHGDKSWEFTGHFAAVAGSRPGLVRVDPKYPFHFICEGSGQHWFWNSTTTYQILAWDDVTIEASLRRLAGLGINRIRVAICGRTRDGKRWNEPLVRPTSTFQFKMEPWVAADPQNLEQPGYDTSRFNLPFYDKIDRLMLLARELGIVVSVIFYVDGKDAGVDPFGPEQCGETAEQLYYRYTIARLAAYSNLMWDVTNEWHLFRTEAWVEKMGAFIKDCDPYDHLTSVHGHGQFPFRKSSWADFAMFQSWDEHGGYEFMLANRQEQLRAGRPMPQVNEEYGYEDHYPFPWGEGRLWPARTADNRRRLAWEMTMAGCYQTTGERANEGTGLGLDTGGGCVNGRGSDRMTMLVGYGHWRRFFQGFDWWKLEPHPDLLQLPPALDRSAAGKQPDSVPPIPVLCARPLCLADPGNCYVVYLPQGGCVTLHLAEGEYHAIWFNPRDGKRLDGKIPASGGLWTSPPAPDAEDWVLLMSRGSSG